MKSPLNHHPFTQLITLIIIMLFSLLMLSLIGLLLAIPLFGISVQEIFQNLNAAELDNNLMLFKYLQSFQTLGLFVVPPLLFAWLYGKDIFQYLNAREKPDLASLVFVVLILFIGIPFIGYLGKINQAVELPEFLKHAEQWLMQREMKAEELTDKFLRGKTPTDLVLNLVLVAVLPAIGEEFLFRGVLQRLMLRWTKNVHWAVLITAFAFSAMHIQFYGFLPRFFLGLIFGYFLVWSGTVWLPVLAHFVNNGIAVVYYYYMQNQTDITYNDFSGYDIPILVVMFSLAGVLYFCYLLYSNERKLRGE